MVKEDMVGEQVKEPVTSQVKEVAVLRKQENSRHCLVCGLKNDLGLHAAFYELENGELLGIFKGKEGHQSYPGRLHGGISSAILDETIGRAIMITDPDTFGVTIELTLKYRKPVPLGEEVRVIGRITNQSRRGFEGTGEILLEDGSVAVSASGRFLRMPLDQIMEPGDTLDWQVILNEEDPLGFTL